MGGKFIGPSSFFIKSEQELKDLWSPFTNRRRFGAENCWTTSEPAMALQFSIGLYEPVGEVFRPRGPMVQFSVPI